MRTEKEILDLIIKTAKDDERIRAVMMAGSRADPNAPKDKYQDYDITYFVKDISPFYDNTEWIEKCFGKPLVMQLPEKMELLPPAGDGHFCWLMIFEDGNRIDLSIEFKPYFDDGEPVVILLDRDELAYAMNMYNCIVRNMLDKMIEWFIGVNYTFNVSLGKNGKYFKKYLPKALYEKYEKTYSDSNYNNFWNSIFSACDMFHLTAEKVADYLDISYDQNEENGMIKYLNMIRNKE